AGRTQDDRSTGWALQLVDPGRFPAWLGVGRRFLWTDWRSARARARALPYRSDLRRLHGSFFFRAAMVALADLSISGRARRRRRMGGRGLAPIGDLAEEMAALAGGGAANRSQCRRAGRGAGEHHYGRAAAALSIPRRHIAGLARALDSAGRSGAGRIEVSPGK